MADCRIHSSYILCVLLKVVVCVCEKPWNVDTPREEIVLLSLLSLPPITAPPPPPTNLSVVRTLSSCRVELSWIPAPPVDTDSALPPTFYRIDARAGGEEGEWEVVVGNIDSTYSSSVSYWVLCNSGG